MSVTVEFAKTGAVPTQCLSCGLGSFDAANCIRFQEDQTCATSEESLGTTHCGTAAIKYVDYGTNVTRTGIFRGCFDCSASGGTKQCLGCRGGDPYQCSYQKRPQICATDFNSLGTTHCGSAIIKYREQRGGRISQSILRGCINCADKKAACLTLGGYLKTFGVTLLECEIECCDSSNCNTQKLSLTQDAVRVFPPDKKAACAVLSGYVKSRRGGVIILACNIQCNEPATSKWYNQNLILSYVDVMSYSSVILYIQGKVKKLRGLVEDTISCQQHYLFHP
ncbi:uncharacterized skeletal organic matrix protein 2-like [Porites lutea]|uniref:uncharacterized skeletal organic matrix protein 2-like n=1 Tax=Porites lutea TaxID=51062 RepID=UPI003CC54A32